MGKYLSKYQTVEDYNNNKDNHLKPHISYIVNPIKQIIYILKTYKERYFTIEALEDGIVRIDIPNSANSMKYRVNNNGWIDTSEAIQLSVSTNDKIQISCVCTKFENENDVSLFNISTPFKIYGNIMSLLYGDDFVDKTDLTGHDKAVYCLFYKCSNIVDASNLILPARILSNSCYRNMMRDCTNLTGAPKLLATTLAEYCCFGMFHGCSSLTTAPELPATTLASNCYRQMFYGCISLTTAPELPATILVDSCYFIMFQGCTSLTTAPELPATKLASNCYQQMFQGCTSLTTAPELPATTLVESCYAYMFSSCTKLTTAPELPATTLVESCYQSMFSDCTSLNHITMLATKTSGNNYLGQWVYNVSSSGTFIKHPLMTKLQNGISGIPKGWTVEDYSQSA